jgi:hypothetical protein
LIPACRRANSVLPNFSVIRGSAPGSPTVSAQGPGLLNDTPVLQATLLHLLGMDHIRLTYRSNGRDMRLTDVGGELTAQIVA